MRRAIKSQTISPSTDLEALNVAAQRPRSFYELFLIKHYRSQIRDMPYMATDAQRTWAAAWKSPPWFKPFKNDGPTRSPAPPPPSFTASLALWIIYGRDHPKWCPNGVRRFENGSLDLTLVEGRNALYALGPTRPSSGEEARRTRNEHV